MTPAKTFRAIARRVKNGTMTVRGILLVARNADADATSNFDTQRATTVAIVRRIVGNMTATIAASLNGLAGAARVSFNALKDVPESVELIQDVGSGNFGLVAGSVFATQANSTDITIPTDADWGLVNIRDTIPENLGPRTEFNNSYAVFSLADLRSKTAAVYGGAADVSAAQTNIVRIKLNNTNDLYLGRTADNKLLVATNSASLDPTPLTLKKIANSITVSATGSSLTPEQLARLLPNLPGAGHRDGRVPRFSGDALSWQEEAGITDAERARLLPELPAEGSRTGKMLAFAGDALT